MSRVFVEDVVDSPGEGIVRSMEVRSYGVGGKEGWNGCRIVSLSYLHGGTPVEEVADVGDREGRGEPVAVRAAVGGLVDEEDDVRTLAIRAVGAGGHRHGGRIERCRGADFLPPGRRRVPLRGGGEQR